MTTEYLTARDGRIAQDTAANKISLAGAGTIVNQGDNGLLDQFVDPALGCTPWQAAEPGRRRRARVGPAARRAPGGRLGGP